MLIAFCLIGLLVSLSRQKDPLNDFCRRHGHQSVVVDNRLYLDGGLVNWNPIAQNPLNYTNTWLLYNDLKTSPLDVGIPQLHADLKKNGTIPSVSGGQLWGDGINKRFYLFGGDYHDIEPDTLELLSYDIIYDQWESFGPPDTSIGSVSWAGGVGVSDLGRGYALGGWKSNASIAGWNGGAIATSTLLEYKMDTGQWTNSTGPDNVPRAEGVMVYLPASASGLLVYFGGVKTPFNNGTIESSPMNLIYVYDIAASRWYIQRASGVIPPDRRRFCAGASWAADQSSYNIYIYGGLGFGSNYTGFDDVYILSLPSFKWIKWWQGSGAGNPHNSLTCNVVNKGQMLIIGGTFPLTSACDSKETWGTHNLDLGKQSGSIWHPFDVNVTSYIVPPEVLSVVGGSALGGATATAPADGFDNADLAVYFTQRASTQARSPTRSISSPVATGTTSLPTSTNTAHKRTVLSKGAIAGIAIGGVALLAALLTGVYLFIRHHNRETPKPTEIYTGSVPQSPHSQFSHNGIITHQLQANSIPAELSSNNYQAESNPKEAMMQQMNERAHPVYARWVEISPPSATSPNSLSYSPVTAGTLSSGESQTSPSRSFSNTEINSRRTLRNQTYYSP